MTLLPACWLLLSCGWLRPAGGGSAAVLLRGSAAACSSCAVLWLQAPFIPDVGRKQMNSCSSPTHFLTLEMSGLPARPSPFSPLPPSQGFARTCVYVCWRACRIIEQTLVALIGTSQSICLWLVGRLNPRWHHRAYNAWCLGLPSLVLSLQPHDWVCPFALEEPIPEKLWSLSGLSAPCAPWAYLQEKLAWPSLGFLPSGQRA